MGFLPIFLALSLFLLLWAIVVGTFIGSEKKKILLLAMEMGVEPSLTAVDAALGVTAAQEKWSLRAKMIRYNRLINSFPYKIVASFAKARTF